LVNIVKRHRLRAGNASEKEAGGMSVILTCRLSECLLRRIMAASRRKRTDVVNPSYAPAKARLRSGVMFLLVFFAAALVGCDLPPAPQARSSAPEPAADCQRLADVDFLKSADAEQIWIEVAAGANVNCYFPARVSSDTTSVLIEAVRSLATPEAVKALIFAGADVNAATPKHGNTALRIAASHHPNPEVIDVLAAGGADINARTPIQGPYGETPLLNAAFYNTNADISRALLRHGADINDDFLLAAAAVNRNPEVLDLFLENGAPIDGISGYLALEHAASKRDALRKIESLLAGGADARDPRIGKRSYRGVNDAELTPLMAAMLKASSAETPAVVRVLLDAGSNPNAADAVGRTPLIWAVAALHIPGNTDQIVPMLLAAGADIAAQDEEGKTACDYARKSRKRAEGANDVAAVGDYYYQILCGEI
jgi:ankyrin repeat protein